MGKVELWGFPKLPHNYGNTGKGLRVLTCVFVCVCLSKIIAGGPQGPPVIFSDNKVHTINIIIHFQIKLKNFLGPR
jgi:hypothetical protein